MSTNGKGRLQTWLVVCLVAATLFCVAGVLTLALRTNGPAARPVATSTGPGATVGSSAAGAAKATGKALAPPAKPAAPTIAGDDLVHVGEDVPAGTYRAVRAAGGGTDMCYWSKSRDAEGSDILDNDLVQGGRPQVTLKKGQWFRSQGCPEWRKK